MRLIFAISAVVFASAIQLSSGLKCACYIIGNLNPAFTAYVQSFAGRTGPNYCSSPAGGSCDATPGYGCFRAKLESGTAAFCGTPYEGGMPPGPIGNQLGQLVAQAQGAGVTVSNLGNCSSPSYTGYDGVCACDHADNCNRSSGISVTLITIVLMTSLASFAADSLLRRV